MLEEFRTEIDEMDAEIASLLNRRAAVVKALWEWKKEHGLEFIDSKREQEIFERVRASSVGGLSPEALQRIFQIILDESKPPSDQNKL